MRLKQSTQGISLNDINQLAQYYLKRFVHYKAGPTQEKTFHGFTSINKLKKSLYQGTKSIRHERFKGYDKSENHNSS